MANEAETTAASGGIGFFGVLIVLGLLGVGPCADSCDGCGPTPASIYKSIKCDAAEAE